jgi:hypothetical protein
MNGNAWCGFICLYIPEAVNGNDAAIGNDATFA